MSSDGMKARGESGTERELQMAPQINVVLNWFQELTERAPVN